MSAAKRKDQPTGSENPAKKFKPSTRKDPSEHPSQKSTPSTDSKPAKAASKKSFDSPKSPKSTKPPANGDAKSAPATRGNITDNKVFSAKSSAEAHAMQRTLAKERKASKPNAHEIAAAKKLWEKLRRKSHVAKDEREALVTQLFDLITGRVQDFVFKHDSVRTIQCGVKYGALAQRKGIAAELQGTYKELARSRYAKFLVAKLLTDCDREVQGWVVGEFAGSVRALINHPEASWILDDTYRQICSRRQKAALLREWYGPEFAIPGWNVGETDEADADLVLLLQRHPEKRKPIMDYLWSMIDTLLQKKMTAFTMLHDAMLQYSLAVGAPGTSDGATEFQESLKPDDDDDDDGDLLKNLAFTASGSRVVCRALAFGTAKDRRNMLRPFKDHVATMAYDHHAVTVLLAAYECVDDTRLVSKLILPAVLASDETDPAKRYDAIVDALHNHTARVALLYPIIGFKLKTQNDATVRARVDEARELRQGTSKKDPETRRQELAKWLIEEGVLFETIENRAEALVATTEGCRFISELAAAAPAEIQRGLDAVAALAQGDPEDEAHVARNAPAGMLLKTLVSSKRFDPKQKQLVAVEPRLGFAEKLYEAIGEQVGKWACSESSFVILNMLEDEAFEKRKELIKGLKKAHKAIEAAAEKGNKGSKLVLEKL